MSEDKKKNILNNKKAAIAAWGLTGLAVGGVILGATGVGSKPSSKPSSAVTTKTASIEGVKQTKPSSQNLEVEADEEAIKAEEAAASLAKRKEEALDKLNTFDKVANDDKVEFTDRIKDAVDEEVLNDILKEAEEKHSEVIKKEAQELEEKKKKEEEEKRKAEEAERQKKEEEERKRKEEEEKQRQAQQQVQASQQAEPFISRYKLVNPDDITQAAVDWAVDFEFTYIGDSLGVGVEPYLQNYFPKANFNNLSSRWLINNYDASTDGYTTMLNMKANNQIKDFVVIALGTNGGLTTEGLAKYVDNLPSNVKHVVFVTTRSEVSHRQSVSDQMIAFANSRNNVSIIDWNSGADGWGWEGIVAGDRIHMLNPRPYANFQTQGLYEIFN